VDSRLDDRTTHELYAFSFAEAVRAGTAFIMSSYNRLNGTQASADALSQNYILKGRSGV
jgi:beta-glucosidase